MIFKELLFPNVPLDEDDLKAEADVAMQLLRLYHALPEVARAYVLEAKEEMQESRHRTRMQH